MKSFIKNNKTGLIITIISFIFVFQWVFWTAYDGITHFIPKTEANSSVDYPALRKYLGHGTYVLFFLTDWNMITFFVSTLLSCVLWKHQWFRSVVFGSICFLLFNLFALVDFKWSSVNVDLWNSYKTLVSHLVIPIVGFTILFFVRKQIILDGKVLSIYSIYLVIFYITIMIIYYSITYTNDEGQVVHLKIYNFMDFNEKVMCFSMDNLAKKIIFNIMIIIGCPLTAFVAFGFFKIAFNIQINKKQVFFLKELPL